MWVWVVAFFYIRCSFILNYNMSQVFRSNMLPPVLWLVLVLSFTMLWSCLGAFWCLWICKFLCEFESWHIFDFHSSFIVSYNMGQPFRSNMLLSVLCLVLVWGFTIVWSCLSAFWCLWICKFLCEFESWLCFHFQSSLIVSYNMGQPFRSNMLLPVLWFVCIKFYDGVKLSWCVLMFVNL